MRFNLARVSAFLKRHRRDEEAAAEAVGFSVLMNVLRWTGVVGASAALAATATVLTTSTGKTYHPQYSLSTKGAALVTRFEGVRYAPYNDPWNCTDGVGHLMHYGRCSAAELRIRITPAQATTLLMHDAGSAERYVREFVTRPINQPQFDALVSFTFNVGGGGLQKSSVLRDVNSGNTADITRAFAVWSYANGVFLQGLNTRRLAEAHLYLTGDYGSGIGKYFPPAPPKPLTKKQHTEQHLRSQTGFYAWTAWQLGEGAWRPYGPRKASVRPHVPNRIPTAWWRRERALIAARHHR